MLSDVKWNSMVPAEKCIIMSCGNIYLINLVIKWFNGGYILGVNLIFYSVSCVAIISAWMKKTLARSIDAKGFRKFCCLMGFRRVLLTEELEFRRQTRLQPFVMVRIGSSTNVVWNSLDITLNFNRHNFFNQSIFFLNFCNLLIFGWIRKKYKTNS